MKKQICMKCTRSLSESDFRGRPMGRERICKECGGSGSGRTPENPDILKPANKGEKSKICAACDRVLPLYGFFRNKGSKDGLSSRCADCMYRQNTFGTSFRFVQEGPPLKRAYYEEKIINGRAMVVRIIR